MMRTMILAAASLIALAVAPVQAQTALVVAGGGGGSGISVAGVNGQAGTSGTAGVGPEGGTGGTMGSGGGAGRSTDVPQFNGGGGAGLFGNGGSAQFASVTGGMSQPGFEGGTDSTGFRNGGFGGGGGGSVGGGGGGGYSGGGGGAAIFGGGGGGGSFLDGSLAPLTGLSAVNPGTTIPEASGTNGFVTISYLPVGLTPMAQTFRFTGSLQSYTFAETGLYSIIAAGGQGGGSMFATGGFGALIGGQGIFTAGSMLSLIVGGGGTGIATRGNGGPGGGGGSFVFQTFVAPPPVAGAVPEPATWAMMIVGFGVVGGAMRRRRKVNARVSYAA